jgi:hypothetical protein
MRKPSIIDLDPVCTVLHAAVGLLRASSAPKRRIRNIESAIFDAIGAISRQGMTPDEWSAAAARMRAGL